MKKIIVTTTINPPTEALKRFSKMDGWDLVVVGDRKTPHDAYRDFPCTYIDPETQDAKYPRLSSLIGWNKIQRRSIGFIEAYHMGADIMATIDDDNIPYPIWGNTKVGTVCYASRYKSDLVFDPLAVTNYPEIWHRGFPIEFLLDRKYEMTGVEEVKCLIEAGLWDGDPDIDAIARISLHPQVTFKIDGPYFSNSFTPFNSQNTIIARNVIPHYFMFPHIGRMDDIWGGYIAQARLNTRPVFIEPTVFQERNIQNPIRNMEDEMIGYKNTLAFLRTLCYDGSDIAMEKFIPENDVSAFKEYQSYF